MPINVCIAGAAGRMGQRLVTLAKEDPELHVAYALEHKAHASIGKDIGTLCGLGEIGTKLAQSLCPNCGVQVLIDFTHAEAVVPTAELAAEQGIALVIGTTGLNDAQKAKLKDCAKKVPIIHASNYSVGVNVLFKAAALVAKTLGPEYEVEIVEAHHDQKLDSPSGTALSLAESIAGALNKDLKKDAIYGREGMVGKRPKHEIAIHALRMGDVVGEHTAYFAIGGERLELTHRATSRDAFARGALRSAKWLIQNKKGPGFYTVPQVLGIDE